MRAGWAILHPKCWPFGISESSPSPASFAPITLVFVTTRFYKAMVLCVADEKFARLQAARFPDVLPVFVVPTETWPIFWFAQTNFIARYLNERILIGYRCRAASFFNTLKFRPVRRLCNMLDRKLPDKHAGGFKMNTFVFTAHRNRPGG